MAICVFILFGIGLVLTTVGGFIAMIRHPAAFNNDSRAHFDPVRKDIPADAVDSWGKAQWNDPKAKWFTRIGMGCAFAALALIFLSNLWSDSDDQPRKTGTENQSEPSLKEIR